MKLFFSALFSLILTSTVFYAATAQKSKPPRGFVHVHGGTITVPSSENWEKTLSDSLLLLNDGHSRITVQSVFLSKYEVTNKDYRQFVQWVIDSIGLTAMAQKDPSFYSNTATQSLNWKRVNEINNDAHPAYSTVSSQTIGKNELNITLLQYKWADGSGEVSVYPDTLCWLRDFPNLFSDPLTNYYFRHKSFDDYPVLGISWYQAKAYADWKSRQGDYTYRLPYASELMLAYHDSNKERTGTFYFPWTEPYLTDRKGAYLANFGKMTDQNNYWVKGYAEFSDNRSDLDNGFYPTTVGRFPANEWGLYDLAGNVAEWTLTETGLESPIAFSHDLNAPKEALTRKIVKGGSWAQGPVYMAISTAMAVLPETQSSLIGFRLAADLRK
ncbi:MAG: SUMF1/EgtB/PvdO family nonheme iron enzyme [Ferruginibacter sp.]